MFRRWMRTTIALAAILTLVACGGSTDAGAGSGGSADDLMKMLPADATGVFYADVQRAMATEVVRKAMTEENEDYDEFVQLTGIVPERDIRAVAGAIAREISRDDQKMVVVVDLDYDRDRVVGAMKEKGGEVLEEEYSGIPIVRWREPDAAETGDPTAMAFLDGRHLAVGSPDEVRMAIDVAQGKAGSIDENKALMALTDEVDRASILWAVMDIPAEAMEEMTADNPMLGDLGGIRTMLVNFDHRGGAIHAAMVAKSANVEGNRQVAALLNGLKAMFAMGAADSPNATELLNAIRISATETEVAIRAEIPDELVQKLREENEAKQEAGGSGR